MQDRIKELAIEAGLVGSEVWETSDGYLSTGGCEDDKLNEGMIRFAQAIARECAEICMARSLRPMPADEGWTENEWDLIQGACELDAVEIEQRFGITKE